MSLGKNLLTSSETKKKKNKEENIKQHPAWKDTHLPYQKEALLQGQKPFSYLLGPTKQKNQFTVSWVQEDGRIANFYFTYNSKTKTWFYRNGTPHNYKSFESLLSGIFHCSKEDLQPLRII